MIESGTTRSKYDRSTVASQQCPQVPPLSESRSTILTPSKTPRQRDGYSLRPQARGGRDFCSQGHRGRPWPQTRVYALHRRRAAADLGC
jgi:hypothetical protein